jgi:hypothetical protein
MSVGLPKNGKCRDEGVHKKGMHAFQFNNKDGLCKFHCSSTRTQSDSYHGRREGNRLADWPFTKSAEAQTFVS